MKKQTTYALEIQCDDVGEYDAIFMAAMAEAVTPLLRDVGSIGFMVRVYRLRPDE